MIHHLSSRLRYLRRDRGATLVEYAMLVGLLAVASITVIQTATDGGEERLDGSDDRISAQGDNSYYANASTSSTVPLSTTTTNASTVAVHLDPNPLVSVQPDGSNRWRVTVTFTLLDTAGNGVIGATMDGDWVDVGQGSTPQSTCTTSTSAGQCTIQYTNIKDSSLEVTYNLSAITGGNFAWIPEAPDEGTLVVPCGSVCG